MKTNQIKRAVLAAAILAGVGGAYGVESSLHVVYCKATLIGSGDAEVVSVTLPPTEGYFDNNGNPLTFWNVGNVPVGGVADSWHGEGGPGRFTAHNEGNVGAYVYVTTGDSYYKFVETNQHSSYTNFWFDNVEAVFGQVCGLGSPCISPQELRKIGGQWSYHLAFTTDTVAKVPTWHSLDHRWDCNYNTWSTAEQTVESWYPIFGYMGYIDAGDYLTFDLKFWAPPRGVHYDPVLFTFCVEASSFPLWEHGRGVE